MYDGRLWFLESSIGGLGRIDFEKGIWQTVAQLPGFTRGLDFMGNLAVIGLSQVRETATSNGTPLVETLKERTCGVWPLTSAMGTRLASCTSKVPVQAPAPTAEG